MASLPLVSLRAFSKRKLGKKPACESNSGLAVPGYVLGVLSRSPVLPTLKLSPFAVTAVPTPFFKCPNGVQTLKKMRLPDYLVSDASAVLRKCSFF